MADGRGEGQGGGDDRRIRRLRARNWAIFAVLLALVLLFYIMTIVRMGGSPQ
jgi:hypothetical protein